MQYNKKEKNMKNEISIDNTFMIDENKALVANLTFSTKEEMEKYNEHLHIGNLIYIVEDKIIYRLNELYQLIPVELECSLGELQYGEKFKIKEAMFNNGIWMRLKYNFVVDCDQQSLVACIDHDTERLIGTTKILPNITTVFKTY